MNFIDSSVDTASGTVVLKADIANDDGALWPGQYVTAVVDLSVHKNATTVPSIAIQQGNDGSFVFLVHPDKTVAMQNVTLANTVGETAVVASGITPGDQVVVDGQLHLQEGPLCRRRTQAAGYRRRRPTVPDAGACRGRQMNISSVFIRRPIATILLSVALAASGLFAYRFLPVAALPEVDFPIITVSAQTSRRSAGYDGECGRDAAHQAVLDDPGHFDDQFDKHARLNPDHARIRSQPRYRPGCGGRSGGNRQHAAPTAGRI